MGAPQVLVDSQLTCLVSDFGMSTALNDTAAEGTYAGSYVRMQSGKSYIEPRIPCFYPIP